MAHWQERFLPRVADWLKPGGQLVFATCSLEPEEGESRIAALLDQRSDLSLAQIDPTLLPDGVPQASLGQVRMLPGMLEDVGGMDGFFTAILARN